MSFMALNGSTLFITPRSPFARRVRLAFLETQTGVPFEFKEKVCDVFNPTQELIELNPLARIPVLVTSNRQVILDSNLILQLFYSLGPNPLMPENLQERLEVFRWMGIAEGLCEKVVEYYINSLRPQSQRDPEVEEELKQISERVLVAAENELQRSGSWIAGAQMSQADLDLVTALEYLMFRYSPISSSMDWSRFVGIKAYFEKLQTRLSIQKTRPLP